MSDFCLLLPSGIIQVTFPVNLSKQAISDIFTPYVDHLTRLSPSKSIFYMQNLMDYPSVEIKLSIFSQLKRIRPIVPEDRVAFVVKSKTDAMMLTAILTVSGHLSISKMFTKEPEALAWLNRPYGAAIGFWGTKQT